MAPRSRIAKIQQSIKRNAAIRSTILDQGAADLAGIFIQSEQQILDLLIREAAGAPINSVRAQNLIAEIDRIISRELVIPGSQWVQQNAPAIFNLGIEQGARAAAAGADVLTFNAIPNEVVRQAFQTFGSSAEFAGILDTGFAQWLAEIETTQQLMMNSIRRELTAGAISGATNQQIVDNLLKDGQFKGITTASGAKISAAERAKGLVRTEGQRSIIQAEVAVNHAAGFDAAISVGVPDERRSGICEVAQRQPPHTIGWWISSATEIAPRHFKNCRDEMYFVDLATFTNADARTLGIRRYNQATYVLDSGKASSSENRRLKREIKKAEDRKRARDRSRGKK